MILADTSIWIEFLRNRSPFFEAMSFHLENQQILTIECVFGELLQGSKDAEEERTLCDYWEALPHASADNLFIDAGRMSRQERFFQKGVGLIDVTILVAAKRSKAKVWTLDKNLLRVLRPEEKFKLARFPS